MLKQTGVFLTVVLLLVSLSGCATTHKQNELQLQGLKNQVSALESQVQEKDQEIMSLRDALVRVTEEKSSIRRSYDSESAPEVKSRPTMKQTQTALKNAGYNPGPIDGKKGRQTRDAIKAFQKANGLVVDGKVGKQTWSLLSQYLDKRVK